MKKRRFLGFVVALACSFPTIAATPTAKTLGELRAAGGSLLSAEETRALLANAHLSGLQPSALQYAAFKYWADGTVKGSAADARGDQLQAWGTWKVSEDGRVILDIKLANGYSFAAHHYMAKLRGNAYAVAGLEPDASLHLQRTEPAGR